MRPVTCAIPPQLTALPHWVAWRKEVHAGSSKPTKVPYSLRTGRRASSTNPADWVAYPDAAAVPSKYAGLGFVFTKDAGFTGIDLDDCLTDGHPKPWAEVILKDFGLTYAEISPSGQGIKIFAGGNLPGSGKKMFVDSAGRPCGQAESDGAVELYDSGRYFTVTGNALGPLEVVDCQPQILDLCERMCVKSQPTAARLPSQRVSTIEPSEPVLEGSRHKFLLSHAAKWRDSGMDAAAILIGLRELNRSRCQPPKPEYELKGIVDWLATKPPKYSLTPSDYDGSAARALHVDDIAVPRPAPTDSIADAEELVTAAIESNNPRDSYSDELINALAEAGDIKQFEAKRRFQKAYGPEFSPNIFNARLKEAAKARQPPPRISPFILTASGVPNPNLANAITFLTALPLRWNSFSCRTFLEGDSPWGNAGNWTDNDDVCAQEWCQRKNINIAHPGTIANAAEKIARTRPYHPVVEYLKNVEWDGERRLDFLLPQYLGAADTPLNRNIGAKWMIQGVQRVMEPGSQADYTLVLEGPQGRRKSSALRTLAGDDWFCDEIADLGNKDSAIQLQGKWIIELSELDAFRKAEMTTIKAFLVRRVDHFRPPFGRRADDFPRQNIFAATTNKATWGNDDTGLRRFWPVRVGKIDIEALAADRDQLWAEAFFRYGEGEKAFLAEPMEALAAEEQYQRQEVDPWTDQVRDWIAEPTRTPGTTIFRSTPGKIYLSEILEHCLLLHPRDRYPKSKQRVGAILRFAKYDCIRSSEMETRVDGTQWRPEYWIPPKTLS